ncbi:MAG: hypothetical protein KGS47_08635 [Chloroflexi bacterium]|jgi:hypothetical protein|nr:hypothetical protein [Chloroflexota bacterium]
MSPATHLNVPSRDEALAAAHRRLASLWRSGEHVWSIHEEVDASGTTWRMDIVRQGSAGAWVCQRYRYDAEADTVYYIGERALSSDEFHNARRSGRRIR